MELDLSEHIQRMVYLGAFEPWETKVVRRTLRAGMCVVDVGANVGYFSVLASRLVGPTGRVLAFEPSPSAAGRLRRTVEANRLSNVRVEQIGLGAEVGEATLFDPLPDNHTPTLLGESGTPGVKVSVRTLDECLTDWDVGRVDLLKVDVEGFEPAVLAGAAGALAAGRVGSILCEFNAHWLARAGESPASLRARILASGFQDVTGSPWRDDSPLQNRLFAHPTPRPAE
jgi:FkbM family methyltransferase